MKHGCLKGITILSTFIELQMAGKENRLSFHYKQSRVQCLVLKISFSMTQHIIKICLEKEMEMLLI
jgi:hypothetical protein